MFTGTHVLGNLHAPLMHMQVLNVAVHLEPCLFEYLVRSRSRRNFLRLSTCLKSQRLSADPASVEPRGSMQLFPLVIIYQIQSFTQTHSDTQSLGFRKAIKS